MRRVVALLLLLCAPAWGVTRTVSTVCASGCNYATTALCEAGRQGDFVTADTIEACELQDGFEDTTSVVFSGSTTNATHYLEVYGKTGPAGKWDEAKAHFNLGGASLALGQYVYLHDIQVTGTGTAISVTSGGGLRLEKSYVASDGGTGVYLYNCSQGMLSNSVLTGTASTTYVIRNRYADSRFHNLTVIGGGYGIYFQTNGAAKNVIAQDTATADFQGGTHTNCLSQDTSATGTNPIIEKTVTFVGSGDYHLGAADASGAKGGGANLTNDAIYPITVDMDGATRPATGAWDIGADQSAATATKASFGQAGQD